MSHDPARIQFELPGDEAWALAQFVKRVGWTEMRENAESEDETYLIRSALSQLADALRDQGYAPRPGAPGAAAALRHSGGPAKCSNHRARPDHTEKGPRYG